MAVIRFTLPVCGLARGCAQALVIEPVQHARDEGEIAALVGRCAAIDGPDLSGPNLTSLAAELTSRAGRRIWAWRARAFDAGATVGVVTLVGTGAEESPRFSLGWLLVDPAYRRRGVGQALVVKAFDEARGLSAREIHVETLERWPAAVRFWEAVRLAAGGTVASPSTTSHSGPSSARPGEASSS